MDSGVSFIWRAGALGASLSIPEISRAEGLSIPNVAKLMRLLRIGGFVVSARGQAGGYTLAKPACEIPISRVMDALGGKIYSEAFCRRHAGLSQICVHDADCSLRSLWAALQRLMEGVLDKISLEDLLHTEGEMNQRFDIQGHGTRLN